jgi:hypothetical protein
MQWWQVRRVANWLNLMTPIALLIAKVGRARLSRPGQGMWLATDYRYDFPKAGAFTIGSVVTTKHTADWMAQRPMLFAHEARHSWQWAACLGLPFLPLYLVAMGWSMLWCGDRASYNVFEQLAGLEAGGYRRRPRRGKPDPPRNEVRPAKK